MVKKSSRSSLEQKLEVKFLDDLQTVCREILRSMHNCPTTYVQQCPVAGPGIQ